MSAKILIVDDERKIRSILSRILTDEGYSVKTAENGEEAVGAGSGFRPDLVLMDQNMPGMSGIQAMERIREVNTEVKIIILTAYGSIPLAVEAVKKGAYDYITKPFDNDELLIVIRRALEHSRLTEEVSRLRQEIRGAYDFGNIIGSSAPMNRVFEQVKRVCETSATVLVQGESGTGKELVARAIHYNSPRREKPLVAVNCGAIPENLIESEFFGYEKGAFTDAKERKAGKFEQADGGTLFLDEIGEFPLESQVKLLRALEDRAITRIGGRETIPVDVRIIAATNKNLPGEVERKAFRLDLLYRLNVFAITLPPLRERREDIPLLAEHFIAKFNRQLGLSVGNITHAAMEAIGIYSWPGNVRDLENAIQSAMILARNGIIDIDDLPLRVRGYASGLSEENIGNEELGEFVSRVSEQTEKDLILRALEKYGHNRGLTAEALGISRKTLFNKIRKYSIES
ncbi:MAG: sigma-54-dependent transcriptional regulator [Candidatus Latescibacterota bacterium]